ncbi:hypothetical protein L1887_18392 [Cichorium endivia]|nr:hypothetical protein L1887_18392 [Cichorium endivia]
MLADMNIGVTVEKGDHVVNTLYDPLAPSQPVALSSFLFVSQVGLMMFLGPHCITQKEIAMRQHAHQFQCQLSYVISSFTKLPVFYEDRSPSKILILYIYISLPFPITIVSNSPSLYRSLSFPLLFGA